MFRFFFGSTLPYNNTLSKELNEALDDLAAAYIKYYQNTPRGTENLKRSEFTVWATYNAFIKEILRIAKAPHADDAACVAALHKERDTRIKNTTASHKYKVEQIIKIEQLHAAKKAAAQRSRDAKASSTISIEVKADAEPRRTEEVLILEILNTLYNTPLYKKIAEVVAAKQQDEYKPVTDDYTARSLGLTRTNSSIN